MQQKGGETGIQLESLIKETGFSRLNYLMASQVHMEAVAEGR